MKRFLAAATFASFIAIAACSDSAESPQDLTGTYTAAVTSKDNGCNFQNWNTGGSAANIPFVVTQQGGDGITGEIQGGAAVYLNLILGSAKFTGTVSGPTGTLTITGSHSGNQGNCAYTVNANMTITLAGNAINGFISYVPKTNQGSDCGVLDACSSRQDLSGSRPPK
ncbi:hypothetical protein BH09MYX1_BH09MYX1_12780 [soil metagenome]